ncbi:MAG: dephospho-CoA kinase [Candidatus Dadabacteria bacterium]|nr:dephospho-CoA kinase [Candidatus Dadabacteria bacterium]NIQ14250.1 dephospho-CoA kinase [Candidatus Dadabacteria bacterium]
MKIYGLTGKVGSGKSTVAEIFKQLGAYIIDADQIARKIVEPGSIALKELVDMFGEKILSRDGTLERKKLAKIVFNDKKKLETLNKITHPKILEQIRNEILTSYEKGYKITIIEAALIGSSGQLQNLLNGIILVSSNREDQIRRVKIRDNLTEKEVEDIIDSQQADNLDYDKADYIIRNISDLKNLKEQVERIWFELNA